MPKELTSRQLEIAAMLSRNGLYIIGNPTFQGWTGVAVVLDAKESEGKPGRLFSLIPGEELSTDAEAWAEKGSYVAGGPFSVQSCQEQERIDDATEEFMSTQEHEVKFWRQFAHQAEPFLKHYEMVMRANNQPERADAARELLKSITPIDSLQHE